MNPETSIADWPAPGITWGLVLLAAAGMALDGSVSVTWLAGETGEYGGEWKEGCDNGR